VVERLELSGPLGLKESWVATIQAPVGPDAYMGDKPVRVCFTRGRDGRTDCEPVVHDGYGFQTFLNAKVEILSQAKAARALVVKTSFSGGAHALTRVSVWSYTGAGFLDAFDTDIDDLGDEKRFISGPLDGDYVTANHLLTRSDETYWDAHRYSIQVYRLDPAYDGYLQVLQYVTARAYPSERNKANEVVDGEQATIRRLLGVVYPDGAPP
jgi:hypothetical protein